MRTHAAPSLQSPQARQWDSRNCTASRFAPSSALATIGTTFGGNTVPNWSRSRPTRFRRHHLAPIGSHHVTCCSRSSASIIEATISPGVGLVIAPPTQVVFPRLVAKAARHRAERQQKVIALNFTRPLVDIHSAAVTPAHGGCGDRKGFGRLHPNEGTIPALIRATGP